MNKPESVPLIVLGFIFFCSVDFIRGGGSVGGQCFVETRFSQKNLARSSLAGVAETVAFKNMAQECFGNSSVLFL